MFERSLALVLCAGISATFAVGLPYRGDLPAWWPRDRIRIVYACPEGYVCFPAKDESRHVNTGIIPRPVRTSSILPADIPPAVQAQETRKRKR